MRMRRIVSALFIVALIPTTAYADDVQTLLAQLEILRAQLVALQQTGVPQIVMTTCDLPTRALHRSAEGDDVARLQQFLARDVSIYPEGTVSGYFGGLTELAVQRWQARNGIVSAGTAATTGYGAVGPKTLAAMRGQWCLQSQMAPSPYTPPAGSIAPSYTPNAGATGAAATASTLPTQPRIMFSAPLASTTVVQGNSLYAAWQSYLAPLGATVVLTLQSKAGQVLGVVKTNLPATGSYYWEIPKPSLPQASACTDDPITCLSQIAQTPPPCQSFCSLANGLYRLVAQLESNSKEVARAESRTFSVGGTPFSPADTLYTGTVWNFSATSSYSSTLFNQNPPSAGTSSAPLMCTYSGVPYSEGIMVEINCADVTAAGQSCGSLGGMRLTCRAGKWVDQNGVVQTVRGVTNAYAPGSCITPWNAQVLQNGGLIPREPFFTNGVYASTGATLIMKCSNGSWQTCDTVGANCS